MSNENNNNNPGGLIQGTQVDNTGVPASPSEQNTEPNVFADIFDEITGDLPPNPGKTEPAQVTPPANNNPPSAVVPPVDPNAPPVPPVPVVETPPAETPEQQQARITEWNKQYDQQLDQIYALPDEVKVHFTPEQAAAQQQGMKYVHKMVKAEILQLIQQAIPTVFKQQFEQHQQGTQVVNAFKTEYPKIDVSNPQHNQTLKTVAAVINQMNPNMTPEQRRKAIGTMVYAQLGLTNDAPIAQQQSSPPTNRQFPNAKSMGGGNVSVPQNPNSQDVNPFSALTEVMVQSGY